MTKDFFDKLKIGDTISGYTITKIEHDVGIFHAYGVNSFLVSHYSLFLIYNKMLRLYE